MQSLTRNRHWAKSTGLGTRSINIDHNQNNTSQYGQYYDRVSESKIWSGASLRHKTREILYN